MKMNDLTFFKGSFSLNKKSKRKWCFPTPQNRSIRTSNEITYNNNMKLLCLGVFLLTQLIKYCSVICLQYKLIKSFWGSKLWHWKSRKQCDDEVIVIYSLFINRINWTSDRIFWVLILKESKTVWRWSHRDLQFINIVYFNRVG